MAITSSYTLGTVQVDGRTPVIEIHVSDLHPNKVLRLEYLAHIDPEHSEYVNPDTVLQLRSARLNVEEAATDRASVIAAEGSFGLNKYEFRQLFTSAEQDAIDEFNEGGYLTNPSLTAEQKAAIKRELINYSVTQFIRLDNPGVIAMVNTFESLGLIAAGRAAVILNG